MNINRTGVLANFTAVGVIWLLFQGVGARLIGFASQIVLARLLAPDDFGMLGLASTVIAVVAVITTFGVDDVLLQRQRTIFYWTTPAFRTGVALALTAFLIVCICSPFAAAVYHSPILVQMLPIMALSMPISALAMVSSVMLRAKLQFKVLAKVSIVEQLLVQSLTIWFAWRGYGPLSFALPLPITAALRSGILWFVARPRFRRSRPGQHAHMFKQGGVVFASRLLTAGVHQGGNALL
jgi:O-antigen/teichoic acid export membrane protein